MSRIGGDHRGDPGWGAELFGWSQRRAAGADVICLAGELDLAVASALRFRLMAAVETGTADTIVLDLSQVRFLDAQCAGIIAAAWEAAGRRGAQLRVVGLSGLPELVFDLLGLASLDARRTGTGDGRRNPGE